MNKNLVDKDMTSKKGSTDENDVESLNNHVIEWAKDNPKQASSLIKGWISE